MDRTVLYPATGIPAARTPWLILAVSLALLPLVGLPHPGGPLCGTLALYAAGIALRRFILLPVTATVLFFVTWFADTNELYHWALELMRSLFS